MNDLKNKTNIFYILTIVLFISFLIRTSSPFFKYLNFGLLPIHIVIASIFYIKIRPSIHISFYLRKYWAFLLLAFMFITYFSITGYNIVLLYNELYNVLFAFYFSFVFYIFFYNYKFSGFKKALDYLFVVVTILVSFSFLKFLDKFLINLHLSNILYDLSAEGTSLVPDHNFYALIIMIGLILLLKKISESNKKLLNITYFNFLYLAYIFVIFFTSSRRALFILVLIHIIFYVGTVFKLYNLREIFKKLIPAKITLIVFICFFLFFSFILSSGSRTLLVNRLGLNNDTFKTYLGNVFSDYSSFFTNKMDEKYWNNRLWDTGLERLFMNSWNNKKHKPIFPINSKDTLLAFSCGYKIDSSSEGLGDKRGNARLVSRFPSFIARSGTIYNISVYCNISENFNAEHLRLLVYEKQNNGKLEFRGKSIPNRRIRDTWQKIDIKFKGNDKKIKSWMVVIKRGKNDFSNLNGSVFYAAPLIRDYSTNKADNEIYNLKEWEIKSKEKESLSLFKEIFDDFFYNDLITKVKNNKNICNIDSRRLLMHMIMLKPSEEKNYTFSRKISRLCRNEELKDFKSERKNENFTRISSAKEILYDYIMKEKEQELDSTSKSKTDSSKTGVSRNNDFSYFNNIGLIARRVKLMEYGFKLFSEQSWQHKLFGGGFYYLRTYGERFRNDSQNPIYPHNPFISHLLFSGVIGLIIYCIFIFTIIFKYIKYRKQLIFYFIFFVFSFFFTFFSGNTHFSIPIFVGLSFVPYIYEAKLALDD